MKNFESEDDRSAIEGLEPESKTIRYKILQNVICNSYGDFGVCSCNDFHA